MKKMLMVLLVLGLMGSCTSNKDVRLAPFYEQVNRGDDVHWQRSMGPFFEYVKTPKQERFALRPLYSKEINRTEDTEAHDLLWPLGMHRRYGNTQWTWFIPCYYSDQNIASANSAWRFTAFPLYWQGRSHKGEDYKALFPFYGTIRDIAGYDYLHFNLFPFYFRTKRASIEGESWLWPFHAHQWKEDGSLEKWRLLPFYSRAYEKDLYRQKSILWPFWHSGTSLKPGGEGDWFFLFPFYGQWDYQNEKRRTWLWPFFSTYDSEKATARSMPWPFYTHSEEKTTTGTVNKRSYWPFYMDTKMSDRRSRTWLWPFVSHYKRQDKQSSEEFFWAMPLYWDFAYQRPSGQKERYRRLWPLFSSDRKGDAHHLRVLDLWPRRGNAVIERNWAAFWTLFSQFESPKRFRQDALWGMYQYERDINKDSRYFHVFPFYETSSKKAERSWNVLEGLVGREEKEWQLLWFIRWGKKD